MKVLAAGAQQEEREGGAAEDEPCGWFGRDNERGGG